MAFDVGVLAERWVKRVFLMPIKLPMSKRETNFFGQFGGEGVVRREGGVEGLNCLEDLESKIA